MEFVFEQSPWEVTLAKYKKGDSISGMYCLTLLEDFSEEDTEDALLDLEEAGIKLDISDIPMHNAGGETALRLRQEQQMTKNGKLPTGLDENDPLRLYLEELAAMPAAGDTEVLAARYAEGDEQVAQQLVNLSLSRVVERACVFTGRGVLLLDLIQEGSLGLWQGVLNYTGGDYGNHTNWWIDQYLSKAVFMQARAGGIGQKLRRGMQDYRDMDRQLLGELGRNPTIEEVAEAIHVSVEEAETYREMLSQATAREQLDNLRKPKEETPDDEQAVENTAYFQLRQRIAEMLTSLDPQQAKLLTLRFGLEGSAPLTPQQAGELLGLTPEEVMNMETAALAKLRQQEQ